MMNAESTRLLFLAHREAKGRGHLAVSLAHVVYAHLDAEFCARMDAESYRVFAALEAHLRTLATGTVTTSSLPADAALASALGTIDRNDEAAELRLLECGFAQLGSLGIAGALRVQIHREARATAIRSDAFVDAVHEFAQQGSRHAVGRAAERARLVQILSRVTQNSALVVGPPGLGKRTLVESLLLAMDDGDVPPALVDVPVFCFSVAEILPRTDVPKKLKELFEHAENFRRAQNKKNQTPILWFVDFDALLQPQLESSLHFLLQRLGGELGQNKSHMRAIACATSAAIDRAGATNLREVFSEIRLEEPNANVAVEMVSASAALLSARHCVEVTGDAVQAAVKLSKRYLPGAVLPGAAIDVLDDALAASQSAQTSASGAHEMPHFSVLSADGVQAAIARRTGIPLSKMNESESEKLAQIEQRLGEKVVGQEAAVESLARAIRRSRAGLRDAKRPIGSFLFLGPTGVGKTELAKTLADFLFDDSTAIVRFDMSEFMEKHLVIRLIGAPPGYAQSDEGGVLTESVRQKPFRVLLFDEVEKAHPDVFNILLQLLDEGRLSDSRGRLANFSDTVVILTSNLGSQHILNGISGEGDPTEKEMTDVRAALDGELKKFFRPEFLNRLDDIVVFRPLTRVVLRQIAHIQMRQICGWLSERGITLEVTEAAYDAIVERSFEPAMGARPLRRFLLKEVQDPLAERLLKEPGKVAHIVLDSEAGAMTFRTK